MLSISYYVETHKYSVPRKAQLLEKKQSQYDFCVVQIAQLYNKNLPIFLSSVPETKLPYKHERGVVSTYSYYMYSDRTRSTLFITFV